MKREIRIPLTKCENLIEDCDVILFRHPNFPSMGWFVSRFCLNEHSHVGLAHKNKIGIQVIEFREFKGGRIYPLNKYIEDGYVVDVYRMIEAVKLPYLDSPPIINGEKPKIIYEYLFLSKIIKDKIIDDARNLVSLGLKYSWLNIFFMFLRLIFLVRGFVKQYDISKKPNRFVCSTLIVYLFRKHYLPLINDVNDMLVSPADIASSSILQYLCTISEI